jgi:hypothetical protein
VPNLPQPFAAAPTGASAPAPYPDLAGQVGIYTKDFGPGKVLAKVCLGEVMGIKMYLAQRGDINVQLDAGELEVLKKEIGGDSALGNPAFAARIGDIEIGDTAMHIAVRHCDKVMTKFLLKHGAEVHLPNAKGETAVSLGEQNCIDVRSNFKIEGRLSEIFDVIDENKDGWVNEPEVIKFGLLTTDNDEENAYAFWRVIATLLSTHAVTCFPPPDTASDAGRARGNAGVNFQEHMDHPVPEAVRKLAGHGGPRSAAGGSGRCVANQGPGNRAVYPLLAHDPSAHSAPPALGGCHPSKLGSCRPSCHC